MDGEPEHLNVGNSKLDKVKKDNQILTLKYSNSSGKCGKKINSPELIDACRNT